MRYNQIDIMFKGGYQWKLILIAKSFCLFSSTLDLLPQLHGTDDILSKIIKTILDLLAKYFFRAKVNSPIILKELF